MRTVYMIRPADEDVLKIGMAIDPVARLAEIQLYCWKPLYLAGVLPGVLGLEASLHRKYARFKLISEWFDNADYILMEIFKLDSNHPHTFGVDKTLIWNSGKFPDWEEDMRNMILPDRMKLEDI